MIRLELEEKWKDLFCSRGLTSFESIFNYSETQRVNKNSKRDVFSFALDGNEFFIKRFIKPHYKDMLSTFLNFGRICSQARCEWNNAHILLKNGIDTYRPVCIGESSVFGIEKRSFFITEKIDGICLTDYLADSWHEMPENVKENFLVSLGRLFRKLHDAGISMPDLYVWHVFITNDIQYDRFALIDLHRMRHNVKDKSRFARNLGAFDFSMLEKYFTMEHREILWKSYLGPQNLSGLSHLVKKINSRSETLRARRRRPDY